MGLGACTGDVAPSALRSPRPGPTVGGTDVDVAGPHRVGIAVLVTGVDGDRWQVAS